MADTLSADSHEALRQLPVLPLVNTDKSPSSCAILQRKEPDNRLPADYDGAFLAEPNRREYARLRKNDTDCLIAHVHSPRGEPELKGLQ